MKLTELLPELNPAQRKMLFNAICEILPDSEDHHGNTIERVKESIRNYLIGEY